MLTELFLVKEQDSAPPESVRHKKGRMGDMPDEFHADDERSKGPMDFHSTFMEVSHHRDEGSWEIADQVGRRRPQGDDTVGRSLESKNVTDSKNGTDAKRTDDKNAISVPAGLKSTQMGGKNESANLAIMDSRAKEQISPDHAIVGHVHKSETLKAGSAAIPGLKRRPASAEKGNSKATLISSETSPAKKMSGSARHTVCEANLIGMRPVRRLDVHASTDTAQNKPHDLKMEMAGAKDKGSATPVPGSGSSRRIDGHASTDTAQNIPHDLKMGMAGVKDKGTATPVPGSGSSRRIDVHAKTETTKSKPHDLKIEVAAAKDKGSATPVPGSGSSRRINDHARTETTKSKPHDLKMEMAGAKDKGSATPVPEPGSSRRIDGQVSIEIGKSDVGSLRGAHDSHGVSLPDQGIEKAWLKTHFNEVLAHRGELSSHGAFSAQGKERPGMHSAESSKRGSASTEMTFKSSQTGLRYHTGAGERSETGKSRNGKEASRFDLARDGQEQKDTSKIKPGEKRVEATGEKAKEETGAAKFANRVSTLISEQGFDRTTPKSETGISDNPTLSAGNTSSSTKSPGNISRFAETEMVRQSFQENGVRQLVEKAALNLRNGQQEFRIELKPELLGQIKVQVSTENHQVTIRILTELPLAKEIIENNVHQLKADLQGHGLEIDKFEVSLSQGSDRSGVEHGSSGSRKMKRSFGQKGASKSVLSTPDMENEDWGRNQRSGNGAISLFA
jgi:flagellar hook-length control protein FliK